MKELLTLTEAALLLSGKKSAYKLNPYLPFPPLPGSKVMLDPEFKKWRARVRRGTQEGTLVCHRNGSNPRGQVFYKAKDLLRWADRKLFPRQEALF